MAKHKHSKKREKLALYVRNFVFGVEDSLVSTVGVLAGVVTAGVSKPIIIITGLTLIFVEAFSMGIGSLLSENSAEEYMHKTEVPIARSLPGSVIMFFSYFVAGFIPLSPYIFWDASIAFPISIVLSLVTLFILGVVSAKFFKGKVLKKGLQMLLIGGFAVIIGAVVGGVVDSLLS